jgi:ZIP family zinc transporter
MGFLASLLAASFFSLLLPAIDYGEALYHSREVAVLIAMTGFLSGLVEPGGGLFGALAVSVAGPLIPWTLAFAAGAMLFVISDEIIPETHRRGFENLATFSLLTRLVFMMC